MVRPDKYPKKIEHFGWQNPNRDLLEVDFVGHSWFFKKEWLDVLFQAPKSIQDLKICGEDMSFSYQLQKALNLPSFVPHMAKKGRHQEIMTYTAACQNLAINLVKTWRLYLSVKPTW